MRTQIRRSNDEAAEARHHKHAAVRALAVLRAEMQEVDRHHELHTLLVLLSLACQRQQSFTRHHSYWQYDIGKGQTSKCKQGSAQTTKTSGPELSDGLRQNMSSLQEQSAPMQETHFMF